MQPLTYRRGVSTAALPAVRDLAEGGVGEGGEDPLGDGPVAGQLDRARLFGLLEPLGSELEEARSELLGGLVRHGDRSPDQWNALFSLWKKPSSGR